MMMKTDFFETGFAQVGPLRMYYEIYGEGTRPLVLIHGGGSTLATSFEGILPALSRNRRVIGVELQGHGHTEELDRAYSFEQDADDVAGLLQSLGISQADFFGFSNGGSTAMQIGIRHAGLVNRLVVASSFYQREGMIPGFFEGLEAAAVEKMPRVLQDAYLDITHDPKGLAVMLDKDRDRMLRFQDWTDEMLKSIQAPVLIVGGDRDVIRPEHFVQMSRVIPKARLMILPANHGSYLAERSAGRHSEPVVAMVVTNIESFLNDEI